MLDVVVDSSTLGPQPEPRNLERSNSFHIFWSLLWSCYSKDPFPDSAYFLQRIIKKAGRSLASSPPRVRSLPALQWISRNVKHGEPPFLFFTFRLFSDVGCWSWQWTTLTPHFLIPYYLIGAADCLWFFAQRSVFLPIFRRYFVSICLNEMSSVSLINPGPSDHNFDLYKSKWRLATVWFSASAGSLHIRCSSLPFTQSRFLFSAGASYVLVMFSALNRTDQTSKYSFRNAFAISDPYSKKSWKKKYLLLFLKDF